MRSTLPSLPNATAFARSASCRWTAAPIRHSPQPTAPTPPPLDLEPRRAYPDLRWVLAVRFSYTPCCLFAFAPAAVAQSDAGKVAAARQLGFDGIKDYQAGNYADSSDKLERAYALVQAPTIGLWSARALVKLGRLVLASERYLETTRLPLPDTNRENHKKAKEDAAKEREALLEKIPSLRVDVGGAPAKEVELTMDGVPVDSALIGVARPVDPGKHHVVAKWRETEQSKDVDLAEGAKESVSLTLAAGAAGPPPPVPETHAERPAPATSKAPATKDSGAESESSNTLAYVALGVGGVGLIAGGITGVMAMGKKKDLDGSAFCRDGKCGPEAHSDVDSLNTLRTLSTVGFVVGAVGVGAGVVLLVTGGKKQESRPSARTEIRVGPGYLDVAGRF
jgi:hypothetical protein